MVFMATQAGSNLEARDIPTGFDFIGDSVGIQIFEGIDTRPDTGGRALWAGMVNTLRISGAGIVTATILGVFVGLARLSSNWIVRKAASIYVEMLRNVPLLVQIIFLWGVFIGLSPLTEDVGPIRGWLHITNTGISMPRAIGRASCRERV